MRAPYRPITSLTLPPIAGPKTAGPGAAAPLAPPLMWHCVALKMQNASSLRQCVSRVYDFCPNIVLISQYNIHIVILSLFVPPVKQILIVVLLCIYWRQNWLWNLCSYSYNKNNTANYCILFPSFLVYFNILIFLAFLLYALVIN